MATPEQRKDLYRQARQMLGLSHEEFGRLLTLGERKHAASQVIQKELAPDRKGAKGVNKAEALAVQLLVFLQERGYQVDRMEFSDDGHITHLPKVPRKRSTESG